MLIPGKSLLAVLGLLLAAPFAAAEPTYKITPLGYTALSINNHGQTTGSLLLPSGQAHAVIETNGVFTDLGSLGGDSAGVAINDLGQVAGLARGSDGRDHAFIYVAGTMHDLGTRGDSLQVVALNNRGVAAGNYRSETDGRNHPFLLLRGAFRDLPLGSGYDATIFGLNNHGIGTGVADDDDAVIWKSGKVINIGAAFASWSIGRDINDAGQVVGDMEAPDGTIGDGRAFLYTDGTMTDLGTFGGHFSSAEAINNRGQVVGWAHIYQPEVVHEDQHAFLYTNGEMFDLNHEIDPAAGWELVVGLDINDHAQILAYGCRAEVCGMVRLDPIAPIPEPSAVAMLLGGLGLMAGRRRRR